jgi:aryl-alcohol dehydrogenase-like predicted oxidoreductase
MKLALGTVQFGLPYGVANINGQISPEEAGSMINTAQKEGIELIDTAIGYGESETCLGSIGINNLKAVSKLPSIPDNITDIYGWMEVQVTASLRRLNIDSLYGLLLHHPEQLLGIKGCQIYEALEKIKEKKLIQKSGISIYSPDELDLICGNYTFDIVQSPFNIIDQRLYLSGWLNKLKVQGVEVHVRSAFLQGLLLIPLHEIPVYFSPWENYFVAWKSWLEEKSLLPVEGCLAFIKKFSDISYLLVGADNSSHLNEIISAFKKTEANGFPEIFSSDEKLINPSLWK